MDELKKVAGLLLSGSPLPPEYLDHPLKGNWKGWRDCHIQPDWILIYKWKPEEELVLGETGSHSELF